MNLRICQRVEISEDYVNLGIKFRDLSLLKEIVERNLKSTYLFHIPDVCRTLEPSSNSGPQLRVCHE